MLPLKQNIIKKRQVDKTTSQLLFDNGSKGKARGDVYKVKKIWDSTVYVMESKAHLSGFYYVILWKNYREEEKTWEPALAMQHLQKLINIFYKNYPNKFTAISTPINTVSSMAKPTVKPKAEVSNTK